MSLASKPSVDPLPEILSLLRPKSYGFRGIDAGGDWAVAFPAAEGLKCYALQAGACWLQIEGRRAPVRLDAGDCVLLPGNEAFRFGSATRADAVEAGALFSSVPAGGVAVINGGGACAGVGGFFAFDRHAHLLLNLLPPVVHVRREADRAVLRGSVERLMHELREPQPGGALLAEHMAQMLLIQALRLHLAEGASGGVGWLFALADRKLGAAMAAMHGDLARHWTLQALADVAGMSRSSFAARFAATVGEPAMEYLTRWRMLVAADRLANARASVAALAPTLGYDSESAFGAAFKRVMGCSPRRFAAPPEPAERRAPALRPPLRPAA